VGLVVRSAATWTFCFLAGPVVPTAVGFLFWIHCGDPALVDWLILAELAVAATVYWMLAIVSVNECNSLRGVAPGAIVALVRRVGYRLLVVVLAAAGLALADGVLAVSAAGRFHLDAVEGGFWLAGATLAALFGATFLLRLLGVWCRRSR
jgi:hypothetical protein